MSLLCLLAPQASRAQDPSLFRVLARATEYVHALESRLFGVVMEEQYRQRSWSPGAGRFAGEYQRVTLRSDYLLVRLEDSDRFYGFRDVFEVNGRSVRDREQRLATLFLDETSTAGQRARGIMNDSARYNIGDVIRNTNTPTFALLFLEEDNRPRFEFERVDEASPSLGLDLPAHAGEVWVIEYEEVWPTTIVTGRDGRNLPSHGRFWIDPASGAVLATELALDSADVDSLVVVKYDVDEGLGDVVPVEMRERYENHQGQSTVDGTATYSRFRQFLVQVEEAAPVRN